MAKKAHCFILVFVLHTIMWTSNLHAQSLSRQNFHNIFTTAGYSAALCAVMGAAILGLSKNPAKNLNYITMGASIGFIGGSVLGTYLALSPTMEIPTEKRYMGIEPTSKSYIAPSFKSFGVKLNLVFDL